MLKKLTEIFSPKNLFKGLIFICLVAAVAAAGYFYWQNRKLTAAAREIGQVTAQVGKLFELPDEQPTLATVTEKEKLQAQEFFQKSENGDKVLIFPNAKKAILYRPSTNKIIEVSPFITTGADTDQSAASAAPIASASATLLNGSAVLGITNQVEASLKQKFSSLQITAKASAKKTDYSQSLVVDLSGQRQALAQQIAAELNGEVGVLPAEETKPNTDILIIVAK